MGPIEQALSDMGGLDRLAARDTPIHRLDPRAKVLTVAVFIATVVSFGKYDLAALTPLALYPLVLISLGGLPVRPFLGRILLVSPFALCIGAFNPLLDREVLVQLGPVGFSGGWVSLASILARFVLTVAAALILVATTGFPAMCWALERFGVPRVFVQHLLFLNRYLFVLVGEGARMARALMLRAPGSKGVALRHGGPLLGHLLLRALDRAERIHVAMLCRAFTGDLRLSRRYAFGLTDALFVAGWSIFILSARVWHIPRALGRLVMEILS